MNNILVQTGVLADTLQGAAKTVTAGEFQGNGMWFYIAIGEFVIILLLLFIVCQKGTKTKTDKQKVRDSIKGDVDFQNIINSSFHATELYNELKVKCHPDRFVGDDEKMAIANKIFQEISKNKMNYKRLLELKKTAVQELDINFK